MASKCGNKLGIILLMKYDDLRMEVLYLLDERGELSAKEIAGYLRKSHESVAVALLRYHRQDLMPRHMGEGKTRIYRLTKKAWNVLNISSPYRFFQTIRSSRSKSRKGR